MIIQSIITVFLGLLSLFIKNKWDKKNKKVSLTFEEKINYIKKSVNL